MNEDELLDARKRAREYLEIALEYCVSGGFLFGDRT
jgi:hypothetical protein